ncbi:MAG: HK97 gp10 family phage protein [Candidatus Bathyarchaeia archaeon]
MTVKLQIDMKELEEFRKALDEMPSELKKRFYEVMGDIAKQIVVRARAYAPVRTGALRASIYAVVTQDLIMRVGAYVYYAIFQEYGTRYIAPRYFLTRAIQENLPLLNFAIQEAISQVWQST